MTTVGSYMAKTHLPELLERASKGEKIIITRRGVPVAMLTPPPRKSPQQISDVIEEMIAFREKEGPTLGDISIRELIEEGRRF